MEKEMKWLLKEKYNSKLTPLAWEDIYKLRKGEHVDYLIGFKYFLNCKIDLSKKPLIPRSETEYWTQFAIEDIKNRAGKTVKILDIFAGSGCVGIAVLKALSTSAVDFVDIAPNCLEQIKINLLINDVSSDRIKIIKSNIFSNLKGKKYDFILANPPYIATHSSDIEKSVLINEPKEALFGGVDGTSYINKFLKDAKKYLNKDGRIYIEFDSDQKKEVEDLLKKYGYKDWKFNKDQFKRLRWVEIW